MDATAPKEIVAHLEASWLDAFRKASSMIGSRIDSPSDLEEVSRQRLRLFEPRQHCGLFGIAGPGAVGKGTLIGALLERLPAARLLLKTTSRRKRPTEVHRKHYEFIDEELFQTELEAGNFWFHRHIPGRGHYGVTYSNLDHALKKGGLLIFEEGPNGLRALLPDLSLRVGRPFVILYLLAPSPVGETLARRYRNRHPPEDSAVSIIDREWESTLGTSQTQEFLQAVQCFIDGVPLVFVVNDEVDRAVEVACSIQGSDAQ